MNYLNNSTSDNKPANILIVDDSRQSLELMKIIIEKLNAKVHLAASGLEAIELAKKISFALIYIDIHMPGMNGFETVLALKKLPTAKDTPLCFITGEHFDLNHILKGYTVGAIDYIQKPIIEQIISSKSKIFIDMHEKHQQVISLNNELKNISMYDSVTKLPSKYLFDRLIDEAFNTSKQYNKKSSLVLLEMKNSHELKNILDTRQYHNVMQNIASRLISLVRSVDHVCKVSENQFALILNIRNAQFGGASVAEKVTRCFENDITLDNINIKIHVAMGIVNFPQKIKNSSKLLPMAEVALVRCKEEKSEQLNFSYYTKKINTEYCKQARTKLELHSALQKHQFHLVYQPKLDLETSKIVGVEALIRWQHPDLGAIPPDKFIPYAESSGLIIPIGDWVIHEALKQMTQWKTNQANLSNFSMAINLSPMQINDPEFALRTLNIIKQYHIDPRTIEFELTEASFNKNSTLVEKCMVELSQQGVSFSIDDFGTDYSSLSRLKSLPVNHLKIDRSFISGITRDQANQSIVTSIIALAHGLHLQVIAEGVETRQEALFIKNLHCDQAQGFLYSKPIPTDELYKIWIETLH